MCIRDRTRIDQLEAVERNGDDRSGGDAGEDSSAGHVRQRTGEGFWLGLHAEVLIAAGELTGAAALLDRADDLAARTGERYGDAHRMLVRARYEYAGGRTPGVVADTLARARRTALDQDAQALVQRVDALADEWGLSSG